MGKLYDTDVLGWSEHQAALLRRHAVGQLSNETPDWANIIEEVESVGRSQLSAVKSLLAQALTHDLKCDAWPLAPYVPHWRAEARGFRGMRQRPSRCPCASGSTWRTYTAVRWTVCLTASTVRRPCRCRRSVP